MRDLRKNSDKNWKCLLPGTYEGINNIDLYTRKLEVEDWMRNGKWRSIYPAINPASEGKEVHMS